MSVPKQKRYRPNDSKKNVDIKFSVHDITVYRHTFFLISNTWLIRNCISIVILILMGSDCAPLPFDCSFILMNQTSYRCFSWQTKEEFEDIKGAIRIRISKKNRQHNGQKKKYKRTNNDLQNIHTKLKIKQHEPH